MTIARSALRRITVTLKGSTADGGNVRLQDFIKKLMELRTALQQTQRVIGGTDDASAYWRIVDLRHQSPATIVLEEVPLKDTGADLSVVDAFTKTLRKIQRSGDLPVSERDLPALEAYRALASTSAERVKALQISTGKTPIAMSPKFRDNLDKIIGPDESERGSITGGLEAINLHGTLKFNIYPLVGAKRVTCTFDETLREKMKAGIDRYVTVFGQVSYKQWAPFPHSVKADDLEILPNDDGLPRLSDLYAIQPDATGDLSSEEFLEMVRDGGW